MAVNVAGRAWIHALDQFRAYARKAGSNPPAIRVARHWCTLARVCKVGDDGKLTFEGVEIIPTLEGKHCGPRGLKNERRRKSRAAKTADEAPTICQS